MLKIPYFKNDMDDTDITYHTHNHFLCSNIFRLRKLLVNCVAGWRVHRGKCESRKIVEKIYNTTPTEKSKYLMKMCSIKSTIICHFRLH